MNTPFHRDKTGKLQEYANKLMKLTNHFLETHQNDALVIAIDAPWGRGKTLFLKEWKDYLKEFHRSKIKTVYLDAWKNDYLEDPFMALIATLSNEKIIKQKTKNKAKKILKNLPNMAKNLAISFVENKTGIDKNELKNCYKNAEDIVLGDYFDSYLKSSKILPTLKDTIKEDIKDKKLYFFVDELDRCKPLFAIKLLEIIKHIFDIPNTVFILGVHLNELANSVKAVYGNDFDANHYLERFIDFRFNFPFLHKNVFSSYCEEFLGDLESDIQEQINHSVCFAKQLFTMETREVIKLIKQLSLSKIINYEKFQYFLNSDTIGLYIFFLAMKMKNQKLYAEIFSTHYVFSKTSSSSSKPIMNNELRKILDANNWRSRNQGNLILEKDLLLEMTNKIEKQLNFLFYAEESLISWMNVSDSIHETLNQTDINERKKRKELVQKVFSGIIQDRVSGACDRIEGYFDFLAFLEQQIEFSSAIS